MKALFASIDEEELLPGAEYMLSGQEIEDRLEPLLMGDIEMGEENVEQTYDPFSERDLIHHIRQEIQSITQRESGGIKRNDIFYDIFPGETSTTNDRVWCIPEDHAINILLCDYMERKQYAVQRCKFLRVKIIIWLDEDLQDAVDYIMSKFDGYFSESQPGIKVEVQI